MAWIRLTAAACFAKRGLPKVVIRWPMAWASVRYKRLCGTLSNFSDRAHLKTKPPPASRKGILSRVWLFPLPSSFVHTTRVLSSSAPPRPVRECSQAYPAVTQLAAEPFIDFYQLGFGCLVFVRLVRERVVVVGNPSQFIRACRRLRVLHVTTRAMSLTRLFTSKSICIRLNRGTLSF